MSVATLQIGNDIKCGVLFSSPTHSISSSSASIPHDGRLIVLSANAACAPCVRWRGWTVAAIKGELQEASRYSEARRTNPLPPTHTERGSGSRCRGADVTLAVSATNRRDVGH